MVTPRDVGGSLPELMVFGELVRRGLIHGIDFFYQSPLYGGRQRPGGYVLDFVFGPAYPGLAINVQGLFWHYGHGSGRIALDRLLREQMVEKGITLIFVDEDHVMLDVRWVVGEALQYRDHSRLA